MTNFLNYEIDKLINITNSLNGIIYGEFIRTYYINNKLLNLPNNDMNEICIIYNDFNILTHYIRVLLLNFELYQSANNSFIYDLILKYYDNGKITFKVLKLNICINNSIITNYIINKNICNLDCNLLSLNINSLYILNYNYQNINLSFAIIYNRILNKKFSFLEIDNNSIINNIEKSIELIKNSWVMDDIYLNKDCIVLLLWKNRVNQNFRLHYTKEEYNVLYSNDNCCICGSDFNDEDIIINTKCNHNFHWKCNVTTDKCGLKYWLEKFSNNCPICRKNYCI
jgi:hypothetical protein